MKETIGFTGLGGIGSATAPRKNPAWLGVADVAPG